jgi:hypothetical protein
MTVRAIILWLILLTMAEAQGLHAAENMLPSNSRSSLETVRQKLQLVKTLLAKSPAIERAARSDDPAVQRQAMAAHALYAKANDALGAGDATQADALLDKALQLIENATRQAPDPLQAEKAQQTRYTELLGSVHGLQATYQDLSMRLTSKKTFAPPAEAARISTLIDQARSLAHGLHYSEAGELLKSAHALLITALNKLLGSTTLMYDLKFKSASEEFDYEMARYHSYEELVPIAYVELKPSEDSIKLSERFVQESREMKVRAKQQAASGDFASAIGTMLEAVKKVQAALQLVGLVLPE